MINKVSFHVLNVFTLCWLRLWNMEFDIIKFTQSWSCILTILSRNNFLFSFHSVWGKIIYCCYIFNFCKILDDLFYILWMCLLDHKHKNHFQNKYNVYNLKTVILHSLHLSIRTFSFHSMKTENFSPYYQQLTILFH